MFQTFRLVQVLFKTFVHARVKILRGKRRWSAHPDDVTITGVGDARVASGLELDAIAACVIGGASLAGGRGTALNTLMGVLILGLISNIMALMKVASYPQQVIKGVIIIVAVLLQRKRKQEGR